MSGHRLIEVLRGSPNTGYEGRLCISVCILDTTTSNQRRYWSLLYFDPCTYALQFSFDFSNLLSLVFSGNFPFWKHDSINALFSDHQFYTPKCQTSTFVDNRRSQVFIGKGGGGGEGGKIILREKMWGRRECRLVRWCIVFYCFPIVL